MWTAEAILGGPLPPEVSWRRLGGILKRLGALSGPLGGVFGVSLEPLGIILGASGGLPQPILELGKRP